MDATRTIKSDLRQRARKALAHPTESPLHGEFSRAWLNRLIDDHPGVWCGYLRMDRAEPDLLPLSRGAFNGGKSILAWPVVENQSLRFFAPQNAVPWASSSEALASGVWNTNGPSPEPRWRDSEFWRPVDLSDISGVLVPGLSFDRQGARLGRGKGCYDRWLSEFSGRRRPLCIGVSFDEFIVSRIPREPHDAVMDAVVTETSVFERLSLEGVAV